MDLGFADRSVIAFAASSGLGLGAARSIAREGATVTICARDEERLAAAASDLEGDATGEIRTASVDITDPDDIRSCVAKAADATGGIDHVIASTGGPRPGTLDDLSHRDWYEAYDLLVMSLVWTIEETRPHLVESPGGSIVAITSTAVREPIDGLALSNVVRRGVVGLIKTAARELAPDVRCNAVLPGAFDTPRIQEIIDARVADETYPDRAAASAVWTEDVPLGRLGDPAELGDVIALLASDRASYVTGACLPVDGGRLRS